MLEPVNKEDLLIVLSKEKRKFLKGDILSTPL